MLKKIQKKFKKILKNPVSFKLAKKGFFIFLFVVVFFSAYHIGYAQKIIPGVKIGPVFVGGLSYEGAKEVLSKHLETLDASLLLVHEGFNYEITSEDVGLKYDVDASISRAFELGRTGNFFIDTKDKLASLVKTIKLKAHSDWDEASLGSDFTQIKGAINQMSVEPSYVLQADGSLDITESASGKKVSDQGIYDLVVLSFDFFDFGEHEIPVSVLAPSLKTSDLQRLMVDMEKVVSTPPVTTHNTSIWELSPDRALEFVQVSAKPLGGAELELNRAVFDSYLATLSRSINKLPRGTVTSVDGGVVTNFELLEDGVELDVRKFTKDFEEALLGDGGDVIVETAVVDSFGDTSKYGIFTLLGEGESVYAGSAAERAHNLTLAASRTNGVLVPPGEIYSFNNSVGNISSSTGYDTAYVISGGRTVLGEGGGVCQTSTTLFRAVLDSGLPVITRYPHAYRVGYYEYDQPVGFDAAIYQPSLDFRFKNDSPNYILVQSSWDAYAQKLSFKLYGTPDGREVEITEPVVTSYIAPPETLYQDDDSLPKGTVKQVDFSAWGATSEFSRTVTKNGEALHSDTFKSTYQPWRAVYLVGTN